MVIEYIYACLKEGVAKQLLFKFFWHLHGKEQRAVILD